MSLFWVPCICVSIFYVLLTMFLAEICRGLAEFIWPDAKGGENPSQAWKVTKISFLEFVAAAEMCGCAFELIIIADNYGVLVYALFLFYLTIWWGQQWNEASACPYIQIEDYINGKILALEAVARICAQVLGGLLVFRYVQFLWSMELAETHHGRPHSAAFDNCTADLQVPVLHGALIEGAATLLCRITSKCLSDKRPEYSAAIDSFVATSLVIAAFDYSGGYYNPVLATSLKYGCKGNSPIEHFLVYWLGASLGAISSMYIYPMLKINPKEKES